MNLYFISGLGADKRVFQKLQLPDAFQIHYIDWIPVLANETLESYCRRLSGQIDISQPFTIIGLSFGGVVAVEMSKFLSPVQTVLVSSFCFKKEVPALYIFMAKTRLYKLIPVRLILKPNNFVYRLFGAYQPAMKKLLSSILEDTDPVFFEWAIRQLFSWENHWTAPNLVRIHGTADKVLPYKANMGAIAVPGGEHLMVYSKSELLSDILTQNLLPRQTKTTIKI